MKQKNYEESNLLKRCPFELLSLFGQSNLLQHVPNGKRKSTTTHCVS